MDDYSVHRHVAYISPLMPEDLDETDQKAYRPNIGKIDFAFFLPADPAVVFSRNRSLRISKADVPPRLIGCNLGTMVSDNSNLTKSTFLLHK